MGLMILNFRKFLSEGWFTPGQESEDSKNWYKKDPSFGDMSRKPPGAGGPRGFGGGGTSQGIGGGTTMMMKKKLKKKQKKD